MFGEAISQRSTRASRVLAPTTILRYLIFCHSHRLSAGIAHGIHTENH